MAILPEEINVQGLEKWMKKNDYWYQKNFGNRFTRSGVPDLVACIEGMFVGFEVKANKGGVPSALQIYNKEWIERCSGKCYFVKDYQETIDVVENLIEELKE